MCFSLVKFGYAHPTVDHNCSILCETNVSYYTLCIIVALVECTLCKMQHFLLLCCSNLQLIHILQAETGYIQSPPPGCPKAIHKGMVQCW